MKWREANFLFGVRGRFRGRIVAATRLLKKQSSCDQKSNNFHADNTTSL
jgi:hypothetical protein